MGTRVIEGVEEGLLEAVLDAVLDGLHEDDRDEDKDDVAAMDVATAEEEVATTGDEVVAGEPIPIQSVGREMVSDLKGKLAINPYFSSFISELYRYCHCGHITDTGQKPDTG